MRRDKSRVGSNSASSTTESVGVLLTLLIFVAATTCLQSSSILAYFSADSSEFTAKDVNDFRLFKKQQGHGWEIWDRKTVLHENDHVDNKKFACRWDQFTPSSDPNKQIPMCLHPERDMMSEYIASAGRWEDCDELTTLWHQRTDPDKNTIYIEVGANIGACVMEMLFSTDAEIVAFEPSPKNLFCLTSTLSLLDEDLRDRVTLFPVALGAESGESTLYMAKGNFGNSVVSQIVKDTPDQEFLEPFAIQVEKLDDLLRPTYLHVGLMKLDAQGFECYIVDGMPNVLQQVVQVKFKNWDHWLSSFEGCSGVRLWHKFRKHGFHTYRHKSGGVFERLMGDPPESNADYVAIKRGILTEFRTN